MSQVKVAPRAIDRGESDHLFRNSLLFVAGALLAVPIAVLLGLYLKGRTPLLLDDLVDLSDPDYPKQIDLWVVAAWGVLAAAISVLLLALPRARHAADTSAQFLLRNRGRVLVVLALVAPVVPWFTNSARVFPTVHLQSSMATLLVVMVCLGVVVIGRRRGLSAEVVLTVTGLVTAALLGLVTATFAVLPRPNVLVTMTIFAVVVLLLAVSATSSADRIRKVALLCQVLIPLLLLVLIAPLGAATTTLVLLAVLAMVLVAVARAVRRASRQWNADEMPDLVRTSTVAILAAYFVGLSRIPDGGVPGDEYHWGELLVQWPQLTTFGQRPFVDFIPAPGLNGALYGAVNAVIGNDAITYQRAMQLCFAAAAALLAVLLCRQLGTRWTLMIVPAIAVVSGAVIADRLLAVAIAAAVLMLPGLWRRPGAWLAAWLLSVVACLVFMPGSGTAFVVASAPAAAVQMWNYARNLRNGSIAEHLSLAAAVIVTVLAAPLLMDILNFIRRQSSANEVAWGLPLFPSLGTLEAGFVAAADLFRMAGWWLGLPMLAAILVLRGRTGVVAGMRLIALSSIVFTLALAPYVFGRIEKSSLTRVGLSTVLLLGILLPLAIGGVRAPVSGAFGRFVIRFVGLFTAVLVGLPAMIGVYGIGGLKPLDAPLVDGPALRLPYLGTGPAAQAGFLEFRSSILQQTRAENSFLDLGNSTAFYYFAGVATPLPVPAVWNNFSEVEQQAAVEALSANPPAVAFVAPINPADPPLWNTQLRSYRITRWLLENGYKAYDVSGTTVLLSPQTEPPAGFVPLPSDQADARLISTYPRLAAQFAVWGANWSRLADRFAVDPTQVETSGSGVQVRWLASDPRPDFLRVDISCPTDQAALAVLSWPTDTGVASQTQIPLQAGTSLIPLGAYPSWQEAVGESLTLIPASGCTVNDAEMARLIR